MDELTSLERRLINITPRCVDYNSERLNFKSTFQKSCITASLVLGTATLVAAGLSPSEAYAEGYNPFPHEYGFFSWLWDGLIWFPNLMLDIFSDHTLAADGTGVILDPNSGPGYYLGFYLMGGMEGLIGAWIGGNK